MTELDKIDPKNEAKEYAILYGAVGLFGGFALGFQGLESGFNHLFEQNTSELIRQTREMIHAFASAEIRVDGTMMELVFRAGLGSVIAIPVGLVGGGIAYIRFKIKEISET